MDASDIPGVREALAWEAAVRARAFLDLPRFIRGVEVVPLTLFRQGILEIGGNAFLCGGAVTPEAVAVFLWVVSPDFRVGDVDGRAAFIARLRAGDALDDLPACREEIGAFLDEMYLDAPMGGGGSAKAAITSQEAVYVELFGEAQSWDEAETLHKPLPKLFQVLRRVTLRKDPEARFINRRSDRVRSDWQRAQQAAAAEKAAASSTCRPAPAAIDTAARAWVTTTALSSPNSASTRPTSSAA